MQAAEVFALWGENTIGYWGFAHFLRNWRTRGIRAAAPHDTGRSGSTWGGCPSGRCRASAD